MKHHDLAPHFTERRIVTGKDKVRLIGVPDQEAREANRALLQKLDAAPIEFPYATGGVKGRSLIDNVLPHQNSWEFYKLDVKDAFSHVNGHNLARILAREKIFPNQDIAKVWLDEYCLDYFNGLIQGAPVSPFLFNLACKEMDEEIGELCQDAQLVYTRYFDDLTISNPGLLNGQGGLGVSRRRRIRSIIENNGFAVNHRKSVVHHKWQGPVTITGMSIYPDGKVQLSPSLIEKVKHAYKEVEDKIRRSEVVSEHDIAILHGYNSVVVSMRKPEQPYSKVERYLIGEYRKILRLARKQKRNLGSSAISGVQLQLFIDEAFNLPTE